MATSLSIFVRAGVLFSVLATLMSSAAAQTAHCFNSLSGPEVPCTPRSSGGGGGYIAPPPSGPSPAEVARRRRVTAGNAANKRGVAAAEAEDFATAIREFAEARRLWPEDRTVHVNYWFAKGRLAMQQKNFRAAVNYFRDALRYAAGKEKTDLNEWIQGVEEGIKDAKHDTSVKIAYKMMAAGRWAEARAYAETAISSCTKNTNALPFCELREVMQHWTAAGQALSHQDWHTAARELRAMDGDEKVKNPNEKLKRHIESLRISGEAIERGDVATALRNYEEDYQTYTKKLFPHTPPDPILLELQRQVAHQEGTQKTEAKRSAPEQLQEAARQGAEQKAEAQRKADEERSKQVSNPNYPNPPPVYRDGNTPREYPDLASFTPLQHSAHNDNDTGNTWAQKGDWVQAMLSYQRALVEDPDGPFSKVIKENLDIATKHVKDNQPTTAAPRPAPSSTATPQKPEAPKEVSAPNCTGWMTANGKTSRLCMDAQAHRYCEEADGKGAVSRVSCQ